MTESQRMSRTLAEVDPEIYQAIQHETARQDGQLELIASENFTSEAVLEATGSVFTNKYAEGYPGKRYYGGCEYTDIVENLARERAKKLFGAEYVNVQPHSGSQANQAAYAAVVSPGDTVMGLNLAHGGHLTHGHALNFSGKTYKIVPYNVRKEDEIIDYDEVEKLAREHQPKMIIAGASAYPRIIDFARFRKIADAVGAVFLVDMAHISGLVAAGVHPNPCEFADIVTSTTHKTLRGPRAGLILAREKYGKEIDKNVFPGTQGGPLVHVVAAKAVCFLEALQPEFAVYQKQVVANARALAAEPDRCRLPRRLRRHRYPRRPARRLLQGPARQGKRAGPRPRPHHGQQERHPLRHQSADEPERHPSRLARRHHPRIQGGRNATGRRAHRGGLDQYLERRSHRRRAPESAGAHHALPALQLEARSRPGLEWRLTSSSMPAASVISASAPTSEASYRHSAPSTGPTSTPWSPGPPMCAPSKASPRISAPPSTPAATTAALDHIAFPIFLKGLSPDLVHIPLNRVPLLHDQALRGHHPRSGQHLLRAARPPASACSCAATASAADWCAPTA